MGEKAWREVMRLTPSHVKMGQACSQTDVQSSAIIVFTEIKGIRKKICAFYVNP